MVGLENSLVLPHNSWVINWILDPYQKWFLFFLIDIKISHRWKCWCKRIWSRIFLPKFSSWTFSTRYGITYTCSSFVRFLSMRRHVSVRIERLGPRSVKRLKSETYTFEFWIKQIFAFWVILIFLLIFSIIDDIQNRMKSVIIYFKSLSDFFLMGMSTKLLSQFIGFYEAKLTILKAPVF